LAVIIELNKVTIYQSNKKILEDINLVLNETEFAYLIGKTGSGKSSLLKILYGELALTEGTGSVAGFDLRNLKRTDVPMLRRKIGIVFQDFQLLMDRTVIQNMIFVLGATGWKDKILMQKRALSVLQLVGVEQKANAMPHALSGGEQQRVAIARALLNQPELLLADEPTGNLDPETSEEIMHLLIAVAKEEKSAILMATHDLNMVKKFPARVLRVGNGSVTEVTL
jgi:cell division transport system ATP-binding protein